MDRPLALITGVGRAVGIGAGIARQLATDGWDLALHSWAPYDRRMPWGAVPTGLEELVHELRLAGSQVTCLEGDLASPETAALLFETMADAGKVVSGLVLSHCESVDSDLLGTSIESFDRHFAVNARASWQLIRAFALQVPEAGGRIVALTSDSMVGNTPYGASKAALDRIVIAAARELANRHILANVINPGPIDTGWMDDAMRAGCLSRQPTGQLGTPADTAHLVSFLFSGQGDWINGQLLKADGGFSA